LLSFRVNNSGVPKILSDRFYKNMCQEVSICCLEPSKFRSGSC